MYVCIGLGLFQFDWKPRRMLPNELTGPGLTCLSVLVTESPRRWAGGFEQEADQLVGVGAGPTSGSTIREPHQPATGDLNYPNRRTCLLVQTADCGV
jgi:hypothetical protein